MDAFPIVARMRWGDARLVHFASQGVSAAMLSSGDDLSLTEPSSISLALFGSFDALVEKGGTTSRRGIVQGAVTLCGPEPIRWVGASGATASEFIEITAGEDFRRDVADELGVPHHADLDDDHGWSDPPLSAIAARFRSAVRQAISLSDIERDVLLRCLYARALTVRFGGRHPVRGRGDLDRPRLARVVEFIEAHLDDSLTVRRLAAVAALSPFHFARAFRQSTGLTPHRYVRGRRLERARGLIASGTLVREVAGQIGYESLSHFRAAYRAHFGRHYEADLSSIGRRGRRR